MHRHAQERSYRGAGAHQYAACRLGQRVQFKTDTNCSFDLAAGLVRGVIPCATAAPTPDERRTGQLRPGRCRCTTWNRRPDLEDVFQVMSAAATQLVRGGA